MASIEKRLYKAWKERRGMRLSAEEVEMLMHRGMRYLQAEELAAQSERESSSNAPESSKFDVSRTLPKRRH